MVELATTIWADGPSSDPYEPDKAQIREWGTWVEGIITGLFNGGLIYSSKAALDADLARPANTMAWVLGDATVANNGIYRKIGASGVGSWTRVSDLPFSFIIASDAGAGTPNAIQATTSIPVSSSALVWMNIFEANTASPVTVSFNGGTALTIKTNSGNNVAAGGLIAGMIVLGIVSGTTFRLVSDQASAAIVAAAEAAQAAAEAARDEAELIVASTVRVDTVQEFNAGQQQQGRDNLGLGTAAVANIGRAVGDVIRWEDTDDGGFPTILTDSRIIMRKNAPTLDDPWTVAVMRKTDGLAGGTSSQVNFNLAALLDVTTVVATHQWSFLAQVNLTAAGGGEHVAAYAQANKNADGTLWAVCTEIRDAIANPTTGTLSAEIGIFVKGTDDNNNRYGIDIAIGAQDGLAGTNVIAAGLRIGPQHNDSTKAQFKKGIEIKGRGSLGLDLTNMDLAYSDRAIDLQSNTKLTWKDQDGSGGTIRGWIAWNSTLTTWQITGVKTASSATGGAASAPPANPVEYAEVQWNGNLRRVALYNP